VPEVIYDAMLLERLRTQRTTLARAESVPPYCVFHDRTLRDIAAQLPTDLQALRRIRGIGEAKAHKYGDIFLAVIRDYLDQQ
jgi:ATP-dependent DNA helicase RecQ